MSRDGGPLRGIFPLPYAPPPHPPRTTSHRVHQRYQRARAVRSLLNKCVFALNKLFLSFWSSDTIPMPAAGNSPSQSRLLGRLHLCCVRYLSRLPSLATSAPLSFDVSSVPSSGPFSLSFSDFDDLLDRDPDAAFSFLRGPRSLTYTPIAPHPVPLVADAVSLPSDPGSAELLRLLPPDLASLDGVACTVWLQPSSSDCARSPMPCWPVDTRLVTR